MRVNNFLKPVILLLFTWLSFKLFDSQIHARPLTLDEGITYWLINLSYSDLIKETYLHQGYSPIYFLIIKVWSSFFGTSDLSLRAPSICSFIGSGVLIYLIAKRFFSPWIALLPVTFLMISINSIYAHLIMARPYGMVVFFILLAFYLLYIFFEFPKQKKLLFSSVSAIAMAISLHYLAVLSLIPLLSTILLKKDFQNPKSLLSLVPYLLLAALPLFLFAPHLLWLLEYNQDIGIKKILSYASLGKALADPEIYYLASCTLLISLLFLPKNYRTLWSQKVFALALLTFLLPHFILFTLAYKFEFSVFIYRYYIWFFLGKFLFLAWIANSLIPPKLHSYFITLCLLLVCFFSNSDSLGYITWDKTIELTNQEIQNSKKNQSPLVLIHSGLQELSSARLYNDSGNHTYLNSIATRFPVDGELKTIPTDMKILEEDLSSGQKLLEQIANSESFYLITTNFPYDFHPKIHTLSEYYWTYFTKLGFTSKILYDTPLTASILFSRKDSLTSTNRE